MQFNRTALGALLGLASCTAAPALAQDKEPAPKIDSTSPGGVSYGTGAFTYDVPVLSIGSGGFPQALQLTYQYRSDGARLPSKSWTTNLAVRTSKTRTDAALETCPPYCNPGDYTYSWNIVAGHRSTSFYKTGGGLGPGPYTPTQLDGSSLEWVSTGSSSGKFVYTSGDGAEIVFSGMPVSSLLDATPDSWIEPDGTAISYSTSSISTNRGIALFYEAGTGKVCAINLTQYYLPSLTSCPSGVPTATVTNGSTGIASITNSSGGTTSFTYGTASSNGADGHLLCVTEPGQSSCTITNTYDDCDGYGQYNYQDPNWNGSRDRVTSQSFATGESIAYSYVTAQLYPGTMTACRGNASATMTRGGNSVVIGANPEGAPDWIQNELGKNSTMTYTGPSVDYPNLTLPLKYTAPEGNSVEFEYDSRGNVTKTTRKGKSGSGVADIVTLASYPSSCSGTGLSRKNCNKPATVTDARGNVTSYTYDPAHGGVLTEEGPAVQVDGTGSAIAPKKRYGYTQRYAWIANGSGGFMHAGGQVWVLDQERSCRTTTTTTNSATTTGCAGGASDEVIVSYDYGPDTGLVGNNLWLRGKTVTAWDSTASAVVSRRTCYGYDAQGNKIWETVPRANLSACY